MFKHRTLNSVDKRKYSSGAEKRKRRSAVEDAGDSLQLQKLTTFFSPETMTVTPISPTTAGECSQSETASVARPAPALLAPTTIESEVLGNIVISAASATTCVKEDVTSVSSDPARKLYGDQRLSKTWVIF